MTAGIAVALVGLAAGGFLHRAAGQVATFSSKLEVVRVDALVTENGRTVRGLAPGDFDVRDNGVVQQVDFASFEEMPLDIVLALDASDSVSGERLAHLRHAGHTLLGALQADDRAALLTFSHVIALRQELTADVERVGRALDALRPGGDTALVDGAHAAMTLAPADGARRTLVIVFSDGDDTASWLRPDRLLESARRTDVTIYGVTVGGQRRAPFLRDLCSRTGGSVVMADSTRDLSGRFLTIVDEFRQRYVIGYSPRGVAPGGFHRLEVRVKGRRATVTARAGYFAAR